MEYPEDESVERKDGHPKRRKNTVQVEEDLVMTILEEITEEDEGASRPARREVVVGNGAYKTLSGSPISDTTDHTWQPPVKVLLGSQEGDEGASRPAVWK